MTPKTASMQQTSRFWPLFFCSFLSPCLLLASCALSNPPRSSDALLTPLTIHDPLEDTAQGMLTLLDDGLWAFSKKPTKDKLPWHSATKGSIIVTTSKGSFDKETHIFVVILQRSWGLVLERLTLGPINTTQQAYVTHLSTLDDAQAQRHNFCVGEGDPAHNPCIQKAVPSTRFELFARTQHHVVTTPYKADSYTLFASYQGIIHRGLSLIKTFIPHALPKQWVAIPIARPARTPWAGRVVYDASCKNLVARHQGDAYAITRASLPRVKHILPIEHLAFTHASDAIVWCNKNTLTVGAPTWGRPRITTHDGDQFGLPLLGQQPIILPRNTKTNAWLIKAMMHTARNDHQLAHLYMQAFLNEQTSPSKAVDTFASRAMHTMALTRPESALRAGFVSTLSTWNRRSNIIYNLGKTIAFSTLGAPIQASKHHKIAIKAAQNPHRKHEEIVQWFTFNERLQGEDALQFLDTSTVQREAAIFKGKHKALWVLAMHAQPLLQGIVIERSKMEQSSLIQAFKTQHMDTLREALFGENTQIPCPDDTCTLDFYGRLLDARIERVQPESADILAHELAHIMHTPLKASSHKTLAPAKSSLLLTLAHAIYKDDMKLIARFAQDAAIASGTKEGCTSQPALAHIALELSSDPLKDQVQLHTPIGSALWITQRLMLDSCQSKDSSFWMHVDDVLYQEPGAALIAEAFIEGFITRAMTKETRFLEVIRAASFAKTHQSPEKCATWNIAAAGALMHAGHDNEAIKHALNAAHCTSNDAKMRTTTELFLAFLEYRRTGSFGTALSEQSAHALNTLRQEIEAQRDPACPGLSTPSYTLERFLPQEHISFIHTLKAPSVTQDTLRPMTRQEAKLDAQALLQQSIAALSTKPDTARVLFEQTQKSFARASDEPHARIIAFIRDTLNFQKTKKPSTEYATKGHRKINKKINKKSILITRIHKGEAKKVYHLLQKRKKRSDQHKRLLLALSFLYASKVDAHALLKTMNTKSFPILCE